MTKLALKIKKKNLEKQTIHIFTNKYELTNVHDNIFKNNLNNITMRFGFINY